jgi:hypothetical protein
MIEFAAITAAIVLAFLTIFQLLLILGLPIGKFAWGGQHTVIPVRLRVASVFSVGLYLFFALIILNQGSVIEIRGKEGWADTALTIITGYFFIGIIMNALSRSKAERLVMTPVATVVALLFLYVALKT